MLGKSRQSEGLSEPGKVQAGALRLLNMAPKLWVETEREYTWPVI
jgi:hypothetical protein